VFNAVEGWSRDATEEIADALADRAAHERLDLTPALETFIRGQARAAPPCNSRCHCVEPRSGRLPDSDTEGHICRTCVWRTNSALRPHASRSRTGQLGSMK